MANNPDKLPASAPARAVALLLIADVALVAAIVSEKFWTPVWTLIVWGIAAASFTAFLWVAIHLPPSGKRGEVALTIARIAWRLASMLFWSVVVGLVVVFIGYGVTVAVPGAAPILLYGVAFAGIALVAGSSAKAAIRRRRVLIILSQLEKCVSMGLPIPKMIEAAAQGEQGLMRTRLMSLHDHLDRGEPLDQALLNGVPEIPVNTTRAIAAGLHMGCLGRVLEVIIRRERHDETAAGPNIGIYWAYPLILVAVIGLIFIYVIPKYQGIYHDFHVDLPWATRLMIALGENGAVLAVLVLILTLAPMGRTVSRLFPNVRGVDPFGGALFDQMVWWTPVVGGFVRDRCMAELCDFIVAGVESGFPLNDSLREAAAAQPSAVMRYRAVAWADAISRGQPMHEAAHYARMPGLFTSMLATVRNDQVLLQVLGFLWRSYDYRSSRTRAIAQSVYVPVVVFVFGTLVALVGMSLIQPMALLSEHIARQISGGF